MGFGNIILTAVIIALIIYTAIGMIIFFIIRATCKYQAKKNAEAFNYDYLAKRIAEETCKRLIIIEKQKQEEMEEARAGATAG